MAKKARKKKSAESDIGITISPPVGIDEEEIQHIIARAIVEAEEIKKSKEKELSAKQSSEWREYIGFKEYNDKNLLVRWLKLLLNRIVCFFKLMFVPAKNISGDRASFGLLQMCVSCCFALANFVLLLSFMVLFVGGIVSFFIVTEPAIPWSTSVTAISFGLLAFLFSRMFRMASIEIQKIEDRNYLFGIFASLTSIVSIIIAVISIVKGG